MSEDKTIEQAKTEQPKIDFKELKKGGYLKQKQKDVFCLRIKAPMGMLNAEQLAKFAELTQTYGQGRVHLTVRQGVELPWIHYDNLGRVTEELKQVGLTMGACGPRIRVVVSCPGAKWCAQGWIDSLTFAETIDREFYGKAEYDNLPHKFKMSVSGCMNSCAKPQENDVGFQGQVEPQLTKEKCIDCNICERICPTEVIKVHPKKKTISFDESKCIFCGLCILNCPGNAWQAKRTGLAMFAGGKWGKFPQLGKKLANFMTEKQAIYAIRKTLEFYMKEAKKGERLANVLNRVGMDRLRQEISEVA
jgi:dissimilatory sulfite reductase (desulfoviridin) alpha/beta subunit